MSFHENTQSHRVRLKRRPFSHVQAVSAITAYRNVFIEDDPGTHFRRLHLNAEGLR
ncbi:TPA: DUF905 family protein [Escherichia coli]|nr:DUF905 domain-containing protein [Escherichia coli O15]HDS7351872.1 DUF905 family protein [Escherichia coli]